MGFVTSLLRKFRFVAELEQSNAQMREEALASKEELQKTIAEAAQWTRFCPHGHFYSPLPSSDEISSAFAKDVSGPPFAAIEFNEAAQFSLFKELVSYRAQFPFTEVPAGKSRFRLKNGSYSPYDAFVLYGIVRHVRPKRIIEVGSGYTSAAILDLNDLLFGGSLELTFIDPDLSELRRQLIAGETLRATQIEKRVQDVPHDVFGSLDENDILFIDTSHVCKVGSDVNHLLFTVLPALKAGVWIHIHDIPSNLEYPRAWFEEGRGWNEVYLLRAFLMYNRAFEVMFSSAFIHGANRDIFEKQFPEFAEGGGGQIWLRKRGSPLDIQTVGDAPHNGPAEGEHGSFLADPIKADHQSKGFAHVSTRGFVGTGGNVLILGLTIPEGNPVTLLIRAIGPGLIPHGVVGALTRTKLQIFDRNPEHSRHGPQIVGSIEGWAIEPRVGLSSVAARLHAATASDMARVGVFPLVPNGGDSAMIATLPPGSYTIEVAGVDNSTGIALAEVYETAGFETARHA